MRAVEQYILEKRSVQDRKITPADLAVLVPLFKAGREATENLLENDYEDVHTVHRLSNLVELQEYSLAKTVSLLYPLLSYEIKKLLSNSRMSDKSDVFYTLFIEGIVGLEKGLNKFNSKTYTSASISYLVNWFSSYAQRELMRQETDFGVPFTVYEKFKKISAVRRKLSDEIGREATSDEIVSYFHSGKADVVNKKGRLSNSGKPSVANQKIDKKIVQEQQDFEKKLQSLSLDAYAVENVLNGSATHTRELSKHVFGRFVEHFATKIQPDALRVLLFHLGYDVDMRLVVNERKIWSEWKVFFRSKNTAFTSMLLQIQEKEKDILREEASTIYYNITQSNKDLPANTLDVLFLPNFIDIA